MGGLALPNSTVGTRWGKLVPGAQTLRLRLHGMVVPLMQVRHTEENGKVV
jgi:hypothetical protein